MSIAVGGDNFENPVVQLEDGYMDGPAPKVVHRDQAILLLVEPVGESGRGGFVPQAQNIESRDAARVFCGLPLRIVEISGHSNDRLRNRPAEKPLGIALKLAQNEG